ncbi:MAG: hypothetical protein KR126chlam3_01449 [Chlamydiae bacterium]|nr:hypothetical protein [Chlamydiota bacterium]
MRIQITQKFRPFSHRPGINCLIPFTTWEVQVFPAKIFFRNLENDEEKCEELDIEGPVSGFTVVQDLERGRVEVFGRGKKGYFRYFIDADSRPFLKKKTLSLSKKRLFMGIHKKQDWEMIQRRFNMVEIFPFWIRMAQLVPEIPLPKKPAGTLKLLQDGQLDLLFAAAFQGILSPRLRDENFLGLIPDIPIPQNISPLGILHEGARQIEKLFFTTENDQWHFLPSLPKEFHAGRYIYLETPEGDQLDIEWSKKELKKVIIRPAKTRTISLILKRGLKTFRFRKSIRQKGERGSKTVDLQEGQTLYLDRFMK